MDMNRFEEDSRLLLDLEEGPNRPSKNGGGRWILLLLLLGGLGYAGYYSWGHWVKPAAADATNAQLATGGRDGKGGRLPPSFKQPERNSSHYYCVMMGHELSGPGWKMDLDANCSAGEPVTRPGGPVYVGTDLPQILAVSPFGAVQWKYTPPCEPKQLLPTLPNHLVFTCDDQTIHGMSWSNETWKHKADGTVSSHMLADSAGTVFYGDSGRQWGDAHLHALDTQGRERWKVELQGSSVSYIALGAQHQLIVGSSSGSAKIICLTD